MPPDFMDCSSLTSASNPVTLPSDTVCACSARQSSTTSYCFYSDTGSNRCLIARTTRGFAIFWRDARAAALLLISLARIQVAIQALTGIKADILTPLDLHERFRARVVMEAQPV
jgi:hypothetical protein